MKGRRAALSMSGYGRGEAARGGWRAVCEVRCVNHRHLDVDLAVPDSLICADVPLRRLIRERIARGHVDVNVSLVFPARGQKERPRLDADLARWYAGKFRRLARSLKLPGPSLETLARMPGVVERSESFRKPHEALGAVLAAARAALARMHGMRAREGKALCAEVIGRLGCVEGTIAKISAVWPAERERYWHRIAGRMHDALARLEKAPKAVRAKEVMGLVERGDVSEELARLCSLCAQFRQSAHRGSPVGRRLDFLAQELQREGNTLGAKCAGGRMSGMVLALREEVERIREQVQNIE